jgi:flagellar assembly protein FliH
MSTSTDPVVLRDLPVDAVTTADTSADLRGGTWTRLGTTSVQGDRVTETLLSGLALQTREAGRAQGFAAGWADGRRGSLEGVAASHQAQLRAFDEQSRRVVAGQQSASAALSTMLRNVEGSVQQLNEALAAQAVELALQIAEAVLGRELTTIDDPAADAIRRAVSEVPVDVSLTVRLHPSDRAGLDDSVLADRMVSYVSDASLSRGDAVVETETGLVDARVGLALARVREVLGR